MANLISAIGQKMSVQHTGGAPRPAPGVSIQEVRYGTMLQVGTWPDAYPRFLASMESSLGWPLPRPGFSSSKDGLAALCLAPGKWMCLDRQSEGHPALTNIAPADGVVTDVGHTYTCIKLAGPSAMQVLRKGPAIDFEARFPVSAVTRTLVHSMGVTIWHSDEDSYELFVYTSFARALFAWLLDASAEFGYMVEPALPR